METMASDGNLLHSSLEQIEGYEEKTLFFFDNIHDIVTSSAFSAFKMNFTDGASKTILSIAPAFSEVL